MTSRRMVAALALALAGCGGGIGGDGLSTDPPVDDGKGDSTQDFFAKDPPPQYCGPATQQPPPAPGGTPDCPADKNREGCPCTQVGQKAPCWPGLRANRNHGSCKDGVTTCKLVGEIDARWGRCEGYVLPKPGATGLEACRCFSKGSWQIDNLIPCVMPTADHQTIYTVSTAVVKGQPECPSGDAFPPAPDPGTVWSSNRLSVDCAGQFKLCLAVKGGDPEKPSPGDCLLARVCIEAWYPTPNAVQELPPLPSWSATDLACSQVFYKQGGYAELTVEGKSIECEDLGEAGKPRVFHRRGYCPMSCAETPSAPGCTQCTSNGQDQGGF